MMWTIGWGAALLLSVAAFFFLNDDYTIVMISLWMAAGSLAALILSVLNLPVVLQFVVFFLCAGIFLFLLRPSIRKKFPVKVQPTNSDMILGKYAPVTIAIDNIAGVGQIKVDGMEWTARSTDGQPIEEGAVVCVHHIEGVKAFVFPVVEEITAG